MREVSSRTYLTFILLFKAISMYSLMKTIVEMADLHKYVETKDKRERHLRRRRC